MSKTVIPFSKKHDGKNKEIVCGRCTLKYGLPYIHLLIGFIAGEKICVRNQTKIEIHQHDYIDNLILIKKSSDGKGLKLRHPNNTRQNFNTVSFHYGFTSQLIIGETISLFYTVDNCNRMAIELDNLVRKQ